MTSLLRFLGNHQHLMDLQSMRKTFVVLVYSDTCPPCQRLKPSLFKKVQDAQVPLYMIKRSQDDHVNLALKVGKIPHVAVIKEGDLRDTIQNSDIEVTWPVVETALAELDMDQDF